MDLEAIQERIHEASVRFMNTTQKELLRLGPAIFTWPTPHPKAAKSPVKPRINANSRASLQLEPDYGLQALLQSPLKQQPKRRVVRKKAIQPGLELVSPRKKRVVSQKKAIEIQPELEPEPEPKVYISRAGRVASRKRHWEP